MNKQFSETNQPMIEVRNLRKEYPLGDETIVALKQINLKIMRGEICCIFGTSGSGKSTLLNQLAGMEKPTRGGVRINGNAFYVTFNKGEVYIPEAIAAKSIGLDEDIAVDLAEIATG